MTGQKKPCSKFNRGGEFNNYGNRLTLLTRLYIFFEFWGFAVKGSLLGRLNKNRYGERAEETNIKYGIY